jgi:hypothetical protein
MVGELITLPVRVGVRATRLWLRAAEETVSIATNLTGRLIGRPSAGGGPTAEPRPSDPRSNGAGAHDAPAERRPSSGTVDAPSPAPPANQPTTPPSTAPPSRPEPRAEPEPPHVSEEPELVEEFAEPGAEDGAGAEIRVDEPWDGYGEMNAKQIVTRLGSATPAEMAAVQLYEGTHRRRQTVLNAAQRELRNANGGSSGSQQRG